MVRRKECCTLSLKKRNDYDVSFRKAIKHLNSLPRGKRMVEIDKMCEQYYAEHVEMPANAFLDSLADQILSEELADTHPAKVTRAAFPILRESQLLLRRTGKGR